MEPLTNRAVIRRVMERHGFTFSKALGQNFIVNPSVCPRIAEEGGAAPGVGVIEIGAGIGVLTAELARRAAGDNESRITFEAFVLAAYSCPSWTRPWGSSGTSPSSTRT